MKDQQKEEAKEKEREKWQALVEKSYGEYRKSGLALMTTVIGLSAGAFVGLFRDTGTKPFSFLYAFPIAVSLIQQLTHYLGSQNKARSDYNVFLLTYDFYEQDDYTAAEFDKQRFKVLSDYFYGVSDAFCWIACLSLGAVSVFPLLRYSSCEVISGLLIGVISLGSFWIYRWGKARRDVEAIEL